MPYTKAISPVSNSYLTKGKEYEIFSVCQDAMDDNVFFFRLFDDIGEQIHCASDGDGHTNMKSWQLK